MCKGRVLVGYWVPGRPNSRRENGRDEEGNGEYLRICGAPLPPSIKGREEGVNGTIHHFCGLPLPLPKAQKWYSSDRANERGIEQWALSTLDCPSGLRSAPLLKHEQGRHRRLCFVSRNGTLGKQFTHFPFLAILNERKAVWTTAWLSLAG